MIERGGLGESLECPAEQDLLSVSLQQPVLGTPIVKTYLARILHRLPEVVILAVSPFQISITTRIQRSPGGIARLTLGGTCVEGEPRFGDLGFRIASLAIDQ